MARTANAKLAMLETLTNDLRAPLYHQIFLFLRNKIVEGIYPDGSFLPSELEIVNAFEVSRITAKRALNELADAGLAVRQRGRGTRVRYQTGGTIVSGSMQSLIDSLRANSRNHPKVLDFAYVPAPGDVALALRLTPGTMVQRAARLGQMSSVAYSHLTTYVPIEIGRTWTAADLAQKPLVTLLERAGVSVESAEQAISATLADHHLASSLDVALGSPLLRVVRTTYTRDDVPIEYLVALYPSDRYHYLMTLTKDRESGDWSM